MSTETVTIADLRSIDLLDDLDDSELDDWAAVGRVSRAVPGDVLMEHGEEPSGVIFLLEGMAEALIVHGDRIEPAGHQSAPTWMGAIAVLTGGPLGVRMQAETDCRVATIPPDDFRRLAFAEPAVHRRGMQQGAPAMSRGPPVGQDRERPGPPCTIGRGPPAQVHNP